MFPIPFLPLLFFPTLLSKLILQPQRADPLLHILRHLQPNLETQHERLWQPRRERYDQPAEAAAYVGDLDALVGVRGVVRAPILRRGGDGATERVSARSGSSEVRGRGGAGRRDVLLQIVITERIRMSALAVKLLFGQRRCAALLHAVLRFLAGALTGCCCCGLLLFGGGRGGGGSGVDCHWC
jgi:hypothetical protein